MKKSIFISLVFIAYISFAYYGSTKLIFPKKHIRDEDIIKKLIKNTIQLNDQVDDLNDRVEELENKILDLEDNNTQPNIPNYKYDDNSDRIDDLEYENENIKNQIDDIKEEKE
ncbi:Uncharacterised protein [Chlamydia trachomatis]|uniref:hypothetical protein n=1 Tax=Elizabethkingia TaxID=308865 RepID=UPI00061BBD80|nr:MULTISPECIES: hypothetical protein [Elizabethkingia]QCO45801.1 hypothetical protein FCS00_05235 [Elizabethkingia sp. 2-6]WQM37659.1 hypothetical protein U2S95_14965 [Elizabethkingia miricola]CRH24920.1 Uncharacterised protein [Chlamydia trachomatis]